MLSTAWGDIFLPEATFDTKSLYTCSILICITSFSFELKGLITEGKSELAFVLTVAVLIPSFWLRRVDALGIRPNTPIDPVMVVGFEYILVAGADMKYPPDAA